MAYTRGTLSAAMAASRHWLIRSARQVAGAGAVAAALIVVDSGRALDAQAVIPGSLSTLSGIVVDATHAPVPGVTVVLEDLGRRAARRYRTGAQGRFDAVDLPAGDYEMEVAMPGFAPFRERVQLAGPLVEREIVLAVQTLEETITVGRREPIGLPRCVESRAEPCEVPTDLTTLSPIGGRLRPPRMLTRTTPIFPEHLQQDGLDGTVRLEGRIDENGAIGSLVVAEASHPDFAAAAEEAARGWTWEETLLNCTPVEVPITVHVRFVAEG
jgi:hypothetical protein